MVWRASAPLVGAHTRPPALSRLPRPPQVPSRPTALTRRSAWRMSTALHLAAARRSHEGAQPAAIVHLLTLPPVHTPVCRVPRSRQARRAPGLYCPAGGHQRGVGYDLPRLGRAHPPAPSRAGRGRRRGHSLRGEERRQGRHGARLRRQEGRRQGHGEDEWGGGRTASPAASASQGAAAAAQRGRLPAAARRPADSSRPALPRLPLQADHTAFYTFWTCANDPFEGAEEKV